MPFGSRDVHVYPSIRQVQRGLPPPRLVFVFNSVRACPLVAVFVAMPLAKDATGVACHISSTVNVRVSGLGGVMGLRVPVYYFFYVSEWL